MFKLWGLRQQLKFAKTFTNRGQIFQLREAKVNDVFDMVAIESAVYHGKTPWTSADFVREIGSPNRLYLVLAQDKRVVAFVGSQWGLIKRDLHVANIAVHPDFQSRGMGTFLIHQLIHFAHQKGLKQLSLEVRISNFSAQKLYRRLGFAIVKTKINYYLDNQEDALDMVHRINDH